MHLHIMNEGVELHAFHLVATLNIIVLLRSLIQCPFPLMEIYCPGRTLFFMPARLASIELVPCGTLHRKNKICRLQPVPVNA